MNCLILLVALVAQSGNDTAEQRARWAREEAKTAAERLVAELLARDFVMLSNTDRLWLCRAYNELGQHTDALRIVNSIPEEWLAKNNELDAKATCYHNVNYDGGTSKDRPSSRFANELAFIQRCLDKGYGSRGVWLSRKAGLLCRTSAHYPVMPPDAARFGGEPFPVIHDREQYEDAFETLKKAFAAEPRLIEIEAFTFQFAPDAEFPVLSQEDRFQDLMKKYAIPE